MCRLPFSLASLSDERTVGFQNGWIKFRAQLSPREHVGDCLRTLTYLDAVRNRAKVRGALRNRPYESQLADGKTTPHIGEL